MSSDEVQLISKDTLTDMLNREQLGTRILCRFKELGIFLFMIKFIKDDLTISNLNIYYICIIFLISIVSLKYFHHIYVV